MKIIDREYRPTNHGSSADYKPAWVLTLGCGHGRMITSSHGSFARADVAKTMLCLVCEKPKRPKKAQDLEKIADACRKYGW